jgi:hypothetical protein
VKQIKHMKHYKHFMIFYYKLRRLVKGKGMLILFFNHFFHRFIGACFEEKIRLKMSLVLLSGVETDEFNCGDIDRLYRQC